MTRRSASRARRATMPDSSGVDVRVASDGIVPEVAPMIGFIASELAAGRSMDGTLDRAAHAYPQLARYFASWSGADFALDRTHLFPAPATSASVRMWNRDTRDVLAFDVDEADWHELHELLARAGRGASSLPAIERAAGTLRDAVAPLVAGGILTEDAPAPRIDLAHPGIYRLQHASVLFRTRTTGVLVDPHLHSPCRPGAIDRDITRAQLAGKVDAIAISHSHHDHWNLATLLMFPRDLPIIVPAVPRGSIMCPDFADILRRFGFTRVIVRNWFDPAVAIGDLEVHALPFYGEQQLRDEPPRDPALYSWGNTYAVTTEDYAAWCLVDTGVDARGSMAEIAPRVVEQVGAIDCVLGNVSTCAPWSPLEIKQGVHHWLTLTADQIARFPSFKDQSLTLGPAGVAQICAGVGANVFLPYANWWGPIGGRGMVRADARGDCEVEHLELLQHHLATAGARTRIVPWCIGDRFAYRGSRGFELHELALA